MSTDPDLLRRAAEKLREHANAANERSPAPWFDGPYDPVPQRGVFPAYGVTPIAVVDERSERSVVAGYIALLHPPVALALADLLDDEADQFDDDGEMYCVSGEMLGVARAVLGEPDPTGGQS